MNDLKNNKQINTKKEINMRKRKRRLYKSYELSERDFYPPKDNRVIKSGVSDIYKGDNFTDYLSDYFNMCENEDLYN